MSSAQLSALFADEEGQEAVGRFPCRLTGDRSGGGVRWRLRRHEDDYRPALAKPHAVAACAARIVRVSRPSWASAPARSTTSPTTISSSELASAAAAAALSTIRAANIGSAATLPGSVSCPVRSFVREPQICKRVVPCRSATSAMVPPEPDSSPRSGARRPPSITSSRETPPFVEPTEWTSAFPSRSKRTPPWAHARGECPNQITSRAGGSAPYFHCSG